MNTRVGNVEPLDNGIMQFINYIAAAVGVAIAAFLFKVGVLVNKKLKKYRHKNTIQGIVHTSVKVQESLAELRISTNSARAYIYQFSNGTYYMNNMSEMNVTCTNESVHVGISSRGPHTRRTLVSQMPHFFHKLCDSKFPVIFKTELLEDDVWKIDARAKGVDVSVIMPIFDKRDKLEGFLGIDFLTEEACMYVENGACRGCGDRDTCDTHKAVMEEYAARIGYELRSTD